MKRLLQIAFCLLLLTFTADAATTNLLTWRHNANRVDADISTWDLEKVLEQISAASGWEILVEPGTRRDISVKFSNLSIENALPRLLGKLNYAILPQTNAPPKLCVYKTAVGKATQLVRQPLKASDAKSKHRIANQLIVTLNPSSSLSIDELAAILDAKVVGRVDGLGTFLLEFFDDEAKANAARDKLKDSPNVASIENNFWIEPPLEGLAAPGSSLPFNLKPSAIGDPNNLIVGLIDSRVQNLDPVKAQFLLPSISVTGSTSGGNELSHGTSMAYTLLQALTVGMGDTETSRVKILSVDVYGDRSATTTFDVASGIHQAVNKGATAINLSLGSSGDSPMLRNLISSASQQGVVFFAAAGNVPTDAPTYPAAYPEVTAVTAGDQNRKLAPYANYGSFVDVIGPGGSIVNYGGRSFYVGGTSVATSYITGLAVGAADASKKPLKEVQTIIRQTLTFQPPVR